MVVAKSTQQKRSKALKGAIIFGLATAACYVAVFLNSGVVMKYFTKGGMYALLPVGTAFLFSFVHGAFTGNFWSALGIEASKKVTRVEQPATQPAKRVRPRPRLTLRA
jgi:membrane protease subunit (stomatin/prohibitin family)